MALDLSASCRDLKTFTSLLFAGCARQRRTLGHLGLCVEALLHEGRRKTHQPAGFLLARDRAEADAIRQRINRAHLNEWSDDEVRGRLAEVAMAAVSSPVALIVDDTGLLKKGDKSPAVQRQYTGTAGKIANCQVVVSTHLSSTEASLALEMDVYLPRSWANDPERRREAGIPDEVAFRTKTDISLDQLDALVARGVPRLVVLADAGYGDKTEYRQALDERGFHYSVGVSHTAKVWRPNEGPDPAAPYSGRGHVPVRRYPGEYEAVDLRELAREVTAEQWKTVELRPDGPKSRVSRFAALRVRSAHHAVKGVPPGPEQWLLVEWPADDDAPSHYFLSNLPPDASIDELARIAKLRWRVERDYQDAKQHIGLAHYEGRRWTGLNHHLTICMAAMAWIVASRALFPPHPQADHRPGRARHAALPHRTTRPLSPL